MELADKAEGRHWDSAAGCWCEEAHPAGGPGLFPAPWDRPRDLVESAFKAVGL